MELCIKMILGGIKVKKFLSLGALVMFLMLVATGCGSSVGTATDGSEVAIEKAAITFVNHTIEGGYDLVSIDELNGWMKDGKDMIIIDTMPADSYADGFIPTAVNAVQPMAMADLTDAERSAFVAQLGDDKDKDIVIYCGFVGCARSHVGAVVAKEEGFNNVYRLPGGIVAWKEAKYDVEKK